MNRDDDRNDDRPAPARRRNWALAAVLVVALVVSMAAGFISVRGMARHESFARSVGEIMLPQPSTLFGKDRIRVLVLGIDYNYDDKDQEYSTDARSDTIMALSLNFPTPDNPNGSMSLLSVPRDMEAMIDGHIDKINTAYALGGPQKSEQVVASFLGLPGFDRYVVLRIDALKDLINAIGGIDVVPDETMNYDDNWGHLHIHFVGGKLYHMNGDQAVSYSRFRHDACSDPCRIKRQQQVVRILVDKLRSDRVNDLFHLNDLLTVINKNVITNFRVNEEESIAVAMSEIDPKTLHADQVPYVADEDLACCGDSLIPDNGAKVALVKKLFLDPVPRTVPVDPGDVAKVQPAQVRVDVLNGTGTPGLASSVAQRLRSLGFVIGTIGNADTTYATSQVQEHSANQPLAADRVKLALAKASIAVVASDDSVATPSSDVTLIVGNDLVPQPRREASAVK